MQGVTNSLSLKLFLLSFLQGIVNGIWSFLSIFLLDIGGSGLEVGILATVPGLASTLMQLAWGRVSDRLGHSWRITSTGFLFTSILSIPVLLSDKPWQVIVATGVQSIFSSIAGVAIVVRLAEVLSPTKRARFMSIYNPMGFAGNIVGSFYTGLMIPQIGYRPTFLAYSLINIMMVALVKNGLQEEDEKKLKFRYLMQLSFRELKNGLRELSEIFRRGGAYTTWCLGISTRGFGIAMFGPIITLFLVQVLGASKPQIGALNSLTFALRLISSPALGWIADRYGPKRIMLLGVALAALHPLTFIFVGDVAQLIPIYILSGLYWAFINSSWFAWQMNLIPNERGVYTGFLNFINGLSWAFGPLIGGYLAEVVGIPISASLSASIILFGFLILIKVPEKQEEYAIGFVPI